MAVPDERFEEHLGHPTGRGHVPADGSLGIAGGTICGDLVRLTLRVDGGMVADAGFEARWTKYREHDPYYNPNLPRQYPYYPPSQV